MTDTSPAESKDNTPVVPSGVDPASSTWPCVLAFAVEMERKLAVNRHKGDRPGWLLNDPVDLAHRVLEEYAELRVAIGRGAPSAHVYWEAADVANMAMMVADAYGSRVEKGLLERDPSRESSPETGDAS